MTVAELVARLGLDVKQETFTKAQGMIDKLASGLSGLAQLFAAHEIKEGLDRIIDGAVESAVHVKILSENLGISTDRVQELGYAAKEIGEEGLAMALKGLANNAFSAAKGGGQAAETFARLGVNIRGANGQLLPVDELLAGVADGMARTRNPTERMAMATQLFGRSGVQMVQVLKNGREGLMKMYAEARRFGIMSTEMIENAKKEKEAQFAVDYVTKTLYNTIAEKLLPTKIRILEITQKVVEWFTVLARNTDVVREGAALLSVVLGVLAVRGLVALITALGPVTVALIAFAAVAFFVFDEVNTYLHGGKTVIEKLAVAASKLWDAITEGRTAIPLLNMILYPFQEIAFWIGQAKDALYALIMLASGGGLAGFKQMGENIREHWSKLGSDFASGRIGFSTVAPSAAASTAAVSNNSASVGGAKMTVNQTINAMPGQSEHAVGEHAGNAIHKAFSDMIEHAYQKSIPAFAGAGASGAGASGGG